MQTRFDAIIAGAGPAGSTAALLLARAGWSVALVEKHAFPRRKVCGECIAASNLPLVDALGIGAEFDAAAGPELRRVALMQGDHCIEADLPAADHPRHAWGRALGRETLDTLLLERARAAGVVVMQPWSVQAIDGVAGDQRCEIRAIDSVERTILRAPVAIAAHGSWEPLPSDRASWRRVRQPGDLFAFKANFVGASLADGLLPVLSFDGGYGGMVRAGGGVTTLACCVRADRLDACRRDAPGVPAGEVVEALLKRVCRGVDDALRGAQREAAWLASGPIDPGVHLRRGDRLLRIGNAAGEAHPIIGEGISMAMQSAWLLCAQLLHARRTHDAANAWHDPANRRYAAEWRRHFVPRLRLAAVFAQLAMRPAAAPALQTLLTRWPGLLTQGARWAGKASCVLDPATIDRLASGSDAVRGAGAAFASQAV